VDGRTVLLSLDEQAASAADLDDNVRRYLDGSALRGLADESNKQPSFALWPLIKQVA
jgi:hypothetical protein